jgi:hypothetical protein
LIMPERTSDTASAILTWAELVQQEREKTDSSLRFMQESVPEMMAALPQKELMAAAFAGLDEVLSRGIALRGPEACHPAVAAVAPYLPRAIGELTRILKQRRPRLALWLTSYLHAVRCCGLPLPPEAHDLEPRWMSRLTRRAAELDDACRQTAALAAVAIGRPDWVPVFTGGEPLPSRFVPGRTFGPNIQGFTRYLATALRASAEPQAVEPAWSSFVAYFPAKLSAGTVTWSDLLWGARAVAVGFEGKPVEVVGRMLHEMVS